jgi:Icc-related predicted phosphoesterase
MQHIERKGRNVQVLRFSVTRNTDYRSLLVLSDIHFDNPKCKRDELKRHLEQAVKKDAAIAIFGDLFCLMQGKYDGRACKGDILPQHNVPNYIDAVIEEAADWFKPYREHLVLVTPGNHETAITSRLETDIIERFCQLMRSSGGVTLAGGYGNFLKIQMQKRNSRFSKVIYSHHGYGGGGGFSRQTGAFQKYLTQVNADIYIAGHIHRKECFPLMRTRLSSSHKPINDTLHFIRTGTYKDEFNDGAAGWANERAMGARPLGGYWLEFAIKEKQGISYRVYETD